MNTNSDRIWKKAFGEVRNAPPDDRVPFAFEKRVMSRLEQGLDSCDIMSQWGSALWKAVAPCFCSAILISAVTTLSTNGLGNTDDVDTIAIALEQVVMAPFDSIGEDW